MVTACAVSMRRLRAIGPNRQGGRSAGWFLSLVRAWLQCVMRRIDRWGKGTTVIAAMILINRPSSGKSWQRQLLEPDSELETLAASPNARRPG
jgi:hypothetical protein